MRRIYLLIPMLLLPAFANATLLRYEMEFWPYAWPGELLSHVDPGGAGYLIANTDLDAIVGGELQSDVFHFMWTSPSLTPIEFLGTYYDWQVLRGGVFEGIDARSGVAGTFDLIFILPPEAQHYSQELDGHSWLDNWSNLDFPDSGPPADQWGHYPLGLQFSLSTPTVIGSENPAEVSEPPTYLLIMLGLLALGFIRSETGRYFK